MLKFFASFLIILNPIALFVYLLPLKKERGLGMFMQVLFKASIISGLIYIIFAVFGKSIFSFLKVDFEAFRIFGGTVLLSFALSFILQGKDSMIRTRGELNKIAAEVALPFIVGAGTITLSILVGEALTPLKSIFTIISVMVANFIIIMILAKIRYGLKKKPQVVFDKNAEILLRLNGFIVGAYGVDLIITGIKQAF